MNGNRLLHRFRVTKNWWRWMMILKSRRWLAKRPRNWSNGWRSWKRRSKWNWSRKIRTTLKTVLLKSGPEPVAMKRHFLPEICLICTGAMRTLKNGNKVFCLLPIVKKVDLKRLFLSSRAMKYMVKWNTRVVFIACSVCLKPNHRVGFIPQLQRLPCSRKWMMMWRSISIWMKFGSIHFARVEQVAST